MGGGDGRVFGVGGCAEPDYAGGGGEVRVVGEEDGGCAFAAEDFGFGGGVEAGAEVARGGGLVGCRRGVGMGYGGGEWSESEGVLGAPDTKGEE